MTVEITVLTGPESCGKSTLAELLASHWQARLVPEVARQYLAQKPSYGKSDLLAIAQRQQQLEIDVLSRSPTRLICDTDLLVIMIWSEVKYGECDPWIIDTFKSSQEVATTRRLYCLCDHHLPWEPDPLRENPDNRDELFELYKHKLEYYQLDYFVAKGTPRERLLQALEVYKS